MINNYDIIIVGSGISGLYTALNLDSRLKVLLLSKRSLTLSNSALAQGGVAAVFDREHDSLEAHYQDTVVAGGGENNPETLGILISEGANDVRKLIEYGVDFDKGEDGKPHLTLEGGHSHHRILHYQDSTGREIVEKLIYAVLQLPNITVLENAMMADVKKTDLGFAADVLYEDEHYTFKSQFLVFATGGIGRVYEYTTNSAIATGDGIELASRLGADIQNMRLVQFHPTAFASQKSRECFLISEAVRGEGAYLLNCFGERFMQRYDARQELAPRDVVSRSIIEESRRTGSRQFYLDITHKDSDFLKSRFPMIYKNLLVQGFDLTKDRIPIFPCQHYLMGGIGVNINARTSVKGLYAVGECSHTGVHGLNRLASNSLLEALVFSRRAAYDINKRANGAYMDNSSVKFETHPDGKWIPKGLRTEVRSIMQNSYFVIPNDEEILDGIKRVEEIKDFLNTGHFMVTQDFCEARSLINVAEFILNDVVRNKEEKAIKEK